MQKKRSVTMKDVAKEAGVALGTVSKVVNGIPVGDDYQKKVEQAIDKLGYRLNSYAQGLKSQKTSTIAFILPNTTTPYFGKLTYFIAKYLQKKGYRLMLWCTDDSTQTEELSLNSAQQSMVDGILYFTFQKGLQLPQDIPMVSIDQQLSCKIPCVTSDNFTGGRMAARVLYEKGCRHLAFIGSGTSTPNEAAKRKDGFIEECRKLQISPEVLHLYDDADYAEFTHFLRNHIKEGKLAFDGIFCITDTLTGYIRNELEKMSILSPQDVQLIGFDGLQDLESGEYACSTMVQNLEKIAKVSVNTLFSLMDNKPVPSMTYLPVAFAEGGTTLNGAQSETDSAQSKEDSAYTRE